jgi:hypothetical protein
MSTEHLKVMAFMLRRHILEREHGMGVNVPVPVEILNSLRIGLEDWEQFWRAD